MTKTISLVRRKEGRNRIKITDSASLAVVGNAIADIVGLSDARIIWKFKRIPRYCGCTGTHRSEHDGSHTIMIRQGASRHSFVVSPKMANRKAYAGLKIGRITASYSNLYRIIVHELGHIARPPLQRSGGGRNIHHDAFVSWVRRNITRLIAVE